MSDGHRAPGPGARGGTTRVELTPAQESFARRVSESKATIPHVYFEREIAARTPLAVLVAAVARALREQPLLNSSYRDGAVERHARVNVAFGVEAAATLVLPVLQDADGKGSDALAAEIAALEQAARDGSLTSPSLAGATFTVIDMGGAGAERFTPVVVRGQAATLGAGTGALTLACDNRVVQAGEGAVFLARVAALLAGD